MSERLFPANMAFTDEVIQRTKQLEKLLTDRGANGRGLHEKSSSIADQLDDRVLSRLRFIASVRNKLMHEPEYEFDGSESEFLSTCDSIIAELNRRKASRPATPPTSSLPKRAEAPRRNAPQAKPPRNSRPPQRRSRRKTQAVTWWILAVVAAAGASWWYLKENPEVLRRLLAHEVTVPKTMTVDEAQREALRRHPDLGRKDSKLNAAYVARYKQYQKTQPEFFQDPKWPIRLADEVAQR